MGGGPDVLRFSRETPTAGDVQERKKGRKKEGEEKEGVGRMKDSPKID
jgi:hypothetical protein